MLSNERKRECAGSCRFIGLEETMLRTAKMSFDDSERCPAPPSHFKDGNTKTTASPIIALINYAFVDRKKHWSEKHAKINTEDSLGARETKVSRWHMRPGTLKIRFQWWSVLEGHIFRVRCQVSSVGCTPMRNTFSLGDEAPIQACDSSLERLFQTAQRNRSIF